MLDAGVPILRTLRTATQGLKSNLPTVFSSLAESIEQGNTLTIAMAAHPKTFGPLEIMVVEAAETSGKLALAFKQLSAWNAFSNRLKRTMTSRMLLPILLIHIAAFVGPLPQLFLKSITINEYFPEVIKILALFYVPAGIILTIMHLTPKTGAFRKLLDIVTLKIPILGQAVRHLALSRYCSAFNMLYDAGVPIIQSAQKAASVTGNAVVADLLKGAAASARAGNPLCEGFSPKLPKDFINLWQIAEHAGQLDISTKRLADSTGEQAQFLFTQLSWWLPRIIYFMVCVVMVAQIFKGFATIFGR